MKREDHKAPVFRRARDQKRPDLAAQLLAVDVGATLRERAAELRAQLGQVDLAAWLREQTARDEASKLPGTLPSPRSSWRVEDGAVRSEQRPLSGEDRDR